MKTRGHACPLDRDTLSRFLDRQLPMPEQQRVHGILNHCGACLEAFRRLSQDGAPALPVVTPIVNSQVSPWLNAWWSALPRWRAQSATEDVAAAGSPVPEIASLHVAAALSWRRDLDKGGFGHVRLFHEPSLGRDVAVKFVPTGESHAAEQLRFGRECCIASNLDHPNIPPVYNVGSVQMGAPGRASTGQPAALPAFSMRFVRGRELAELIKEWHTTAMPADRRGKVDLRALLRSVLAVCQTVHFAHRRGVAHGDLKPSNLLVQNETTYVIDWGLARLYGTSWPAGPNEVGDPHDASPLLWERIPASLRSVPEDGGGTAGYMAPEQAGRDEPRVDGRWTDIYLLGALLFAVLSSRSPYVRRRDEQTADFLARIADRRDRPDVRATRRLLRAGSVVERVLPGEIPAELASICDKAMRYEASERYPTAAHMAADLERFLEGRPVDAHRYGWSERWTLAARRHALAMIVGLVGIAALLVVLLVTLTLLGRAWTNEITARRLANEKTASALRAEATAIWQAKVAEEHRQTADRFARVAEENADNSRAMRYQIAANAAQRDLEAGNSLKTDLLLGDSPPTWESRYLRNLAAQRATRDSSLSLGTWGVLDLALHADRRRLLAADATGVLTLWDLSTGRVLRQWGEPRFDQETQSPTHHGAGRDWTPPFEQWGGCASAAVWIDDGDQLAVAMTDGRGVLRDANGGDERTLVESPRAILTVASDNKGAVLFGTADGRVILRSVRDSLACERVVGDAPITEIRWHGAQQRWLVGDEAGNLVTLSADQLEEIARVRLDEPIWSFDVVGRTDEAEVTVATEQGLFVYQWQVRPERWLRVGAYRFPDVEAKRVVQRVRYAIDGGQVFGFASDGTLAAWNRADAKLAWITRATSIDTRRAALFRRMSIAVPAVALPRAWRRVGASLIPQPDMPSVLTGGDDGVVSKWALPPTLDKRVHRSQGSVGPDPRLAFDEAGGGRLWALDHAGGLSVLDAETGRVVSRLEQAHQGGGAGIVALPGESGVATVGGDGFLRRWHWNDGAIVKSGEDIGNDQPFLAVAASADGQLLATMDQRATLSVWRRDDGSQVFREALQGTSVTPPATGKLAFNRDTTRLAVFGPGHSGYVYVIQGRPWRFHRLPDQLLVAGERGGTALIWNPALPHVVLNADDFPRLNSRSFADADDAREYAFEHGDGTTVAFGATRDDARIISLETAGKILVHDARWQRKMLELTSGLANPIDLAVDPEQRWLAVTNQAGEVEFWDGGARYFAPPEIRLAESVAEWNAVDVFERTTDRPHVALPTVQFDARGRLCMLVCIQRPGDSRDDGELRFLRHDGGTLTSETLAPAGAKFARRMSAIAADLAFAREGEPVVAARCRTAERDRYDGKFYVGRRTSDGEWHFETVLEHGNTGFYPCILSAMDGPSASVLHFNFTTMQLQLSSRSPDSGWSCSAVGRQGDGLIAGWQRDAAGRIHGVARIVRFREDLTLRVYLCFGADGQLVRREIIPFRELIGEQVRLAPDGTPVVLGKMYDRSRNRDVIQLHRLTNLGWQLAQTLPTTNFLAWAVAPDGATHLLDYDPASRRIALLVGQDDSWTRSPVGQLRESVREARILYDRAGRPAFYVHSQIMPSGWAQLWSPAR